MWRGLCHNSEQSVNKLPENTFNFISLPSTEFVENLNIKSKLLSFFTDGKWGSSKSTSGRRFGAPGFELNIFSRSSPSQILSFFLSLFKNAMTSANRRVNSYWPAGAKAGRLPRHSIFIYTPSPFLYNSIGPRFLSNPPESLSPHLSVFPPLIASSRKDDSFCPVTSTIKMNVYIAMVPIQNSVLDTLRCFIITNGIFSFSFVDTSTVTTTIQGLFLIPLSYVDLKLLRIYLIKMQENPLYPKTAELSHVFENLMLIQICLLKIMKNATCHTNDTRTHVKCMKRYSETSQGISAWSSMCYKLLFALSGGERNCF